MQSLRSLALAASTMRSPASAESARGFSQSTSQPASSASMVGCSCSLLGVHMETASRFSAASMSFQSEYRPWMPNFSRWRSMVASETSAMATISTSFRVARSRMWAPAMPPAPMNP